MRLKITKSAEKSIKRLDKTMRKRVIDGINKLPEGDVRKLKGFTDDYRLRIGDYRVLYQVDGDTITITDVLPRSEAYKRL